MLQLTQHDRQVSSDYELLRSFNICTVRDETCWPHRPDPFLYTYQRDYLSRLGSRRCGLYPSLWVWQRAGVETSVGAGRDCGYGGNLAGNFNCDTTFPEDDVPHGWDLRAERPAQRLQRIEAVRKIFADADEVRTQAQIALAWIWTRSEQTIPGFKTVARVKGNIQALEFGLLSMEQMNKIDEILERAPVIS